MAYRILFLLLFPFIFSCSKRNIVVRQMKPTAIKIYNEPSGGFIIGYYGTLALSVTNIETDTSYSVIVK